MNIKANAKINLSLEIVGTDERGYHLLRTVMQSLKLCDDIEISVSEDGGVQLEMIDERGLGGGAIPCDQSNLMCRAAELMIRECNIDGGVSMRLVKRIPSEAGLGGGSADAAAVLRGMNELFSLNLSNTELERIGLKLGADVPYCVRGGTVLAEGIGEVLRDIDSKCSLYVLIVKPKQGMSTPKVYAAYDRMQAATGVSTDTAVTNTVANIAASGTDEKLPRTEIAIASEINLHCTELSAGEVSHPTDTSQVQDNTDELVAALKCGNCTLVYKKITNVLEVPATIELPLIAQIKHDLLRHGAQAAAMTGSGSAVYGLFSDRAALQLAHRSLENCGYLGEIQDIIETAFA